MTRETERRLRALEARAADLAASRPSAGEIDAAVERFGRELAADAVRGIKYPTITVGGYRDMLGTMPPWMAHAFLRAEPVDLFL